MGCWTCSKSLLPCSASWTAPVWWPWWAWSARPAVSAILSLCKTFQYTSCVSPKHANSLTVQLIIRTVGVLLHNNFLKKCNSSTIWPRAHSKRHKNESFWNYWKRKQSVDNLLGLILSPLIHLFKRCHLSDSRILYTYIQGGSEIPYHPFYWFAVSNVRRGW